MANRNNAKNEKGIKGLRINIKILMVGGGLKILNNDRGGHMSLKNR